MEDLRLLHRRVGSLRAAPEGERDHPRKPAHLLFRQLVLGMVRQAWVVHGLDLGMVLQELGDGEGVLLVLAHANGEGLEAAEYDPGVERAWYGAGGVLVELDPLLELLVRGRDSPADDVRMAAHVLGRRVDHDVSAESERVLEIRRGEGVVHRDEGAPLVRHFRELRYVGEGEHRVGRGLDPEQPRLGPERFFDGGSIRGIRVGEVKPAGARKDLIEEAIGAAVEVVSGDDVVPRREEAHHRGRRSKPGGEGEAVFGALEGRHALFESGAGRVARPAVLVALVLAWRLLGVGGGLVDRDYRRPRRGVGGLPRVYGASGEPTACELHDPSSRTRYGLLRSSCVASELASTQSSSKALET